MIWYLNGVPHLLAHVGADPHSRQRGVELLPSSFSKKGYLPSVPDQTSHARVFHKARGVGVSTAWGWGWDGVERMLLVYTEKSSDGAIL